MKISVAIPTFNSSATIEATLQSVLQQTVAPDEIVIVDDGSTDDTVRVLDGFASRVKVVRQQNGGVAAARNVLSKLVNGELVAFLDHDDIWHPRYLEVQQEQFRRHTGASAFFTGHLNFHGYGAPKWGSGPNGDPKTELFDPVDFLRWYNKATGRFGSMSYFCIPKARLNEIGAEPFRIDGVDDSYLCSALPLLLRPIVYCDLPLVAYRITREAQSADKLKAFGRWVQVFESLAGRYEIQPNASLKRAFGAAFASKRRSYSKLLMGAGRVAEAREQISSSVENTKSLSSRAKSAALLISTYLPASLQPVWPESLRTDDASCT
jgi:glycosyltransferase involved in cell wall biosynthesis